MDRVEEIVRMVINGWTEIDTPLVLLRGRMQLDIIGALRSYRDDGLEEAKDVVKAHKWDRDKLSTVAVMDLIVNAIEALKSGKEKR